ncbi:MAG: 2'-5' RNA ligase family protein [Chloroflexota bacterium]
MSAPHADRGSSARRGGLIVPVPEAEQVVQAWHARLHPSEQALPAHVTLLFPFLTLTEIDPANLAWLQAYFAGLPAVDVSFSTVGRFPDVVYLGPEPRNWFVRCTEALTARFGLLPYGGLHQEIVPHLTVARHADPQVCAEAAQALTQVLPITTRVNAAWLMEETEAGRWTHTATFPFGPPPP